MASGISMSRSTQFNVKGFRNESSILPITFSNNVNPPPLL